MERLARSIAVTALFAAAVVIGLAALDLVDIRWPGFDVADVERAIGPVPEAPAEIIRIEPITLDCRARVHAQVPVHGTKEHRAFGQVYRTDRVELLAVGDIDTCVDATRVAIVEGEDGGTSVIVPADAIRFVRPRVDAEATLGSVTYRKGLIGKLTDALPWVDDTEGLTSAGYAFAQNMVGSSECMSAAFAATTSALTAAYTAQAAAIGYPGDVDVDIIGEPVFDQQPPSRLEGFAFTVGDETSCVVNTAVAPRS